MSRLRLRISRWQRGRGLAHRNLDCTCPRLIFVHCRSRLPVSYFGICALDGNNEVHVFILQAPPSCNIEVSLAMLPVGGGIARLEFPGLYDTYNTNISES